jgi:hypothetical protein
MLQTKTENDRTNLHRKIKVSARAICPCAYLFFNIQEKGLYAA